VKVANDLLIASDSCSTSILILLDLSSAFDTINHALLFNCLEQVFGLFETVLDWFKSYFTDRSQFVFMDGYRSKVGSVHTGVPQGSVLGPLLFSMYIYPLRQLLHSLNLNYHCYADNTQIYRHSRAGQQVNGRHLSDCIAEIKTWMSNHFPH